MATESLSSSRIATAKHKVSRKCASHLFCFVLDCNEYRAARPLSHLCPGELAAPTSIFQGLGNWLALLITASVLLICTTGGSPHRASQRWKTCSETVTDTAPIEPRMFDYIRALLSSMLARYSTSSFLKMIAGPQTVYYWHLLQLQVKLLLRYVIGVFSYVNLDLFGLSSSQCTSRAPQPHH